MESLEAVKKSATPVKQTAATNGNLCGTSYHAQVSTAGHDTVNQISCGASVAGLTFSPHGTKNSASMIRFGQIRAFLK